MAKPQVTLTFAGETKQLEQAFDKVDSSSKAMATSVDKSSTSLKNVGGGFDKARESADELDTKAMGFRDTMTGVQDTGLGLSKIMKGDMFDGFLTLGMGVGDLGSGMANFLVPAFKKLTFATKIQTVAQRALNLVMRANPIGLVITALVLLGSAFVLLWKRSDTFRRVVTGAFRLVSTQARIMLNIARGVFTALGRAAQAMGRAIAGVARAIAAPFRAAFNGIRSAWNSTVGGRGFSIPSWVPGLGGKEFRIPRMHQGGIFPGAPGTEGLALLQAGERVTPAGRGGRTVIEIRGDGSRLGELLVEVLRNQVRVKGGDVQLVLGR